MKKKKAILIDEYHEYPIDPSKLEKAGDGFLGNSTGYIGAIVSVTQGEGSTSITLKDGTEFEFSPKVDLTPGQRVRINYIDLTLEIIE